MAPSSSLQVVGSWVIPRPISYALLAFGGACLARLTLSVLRAWAATSNSRRVFIDGLRGRSTVQDVGDGGAPFVLGFLELLAYPVLIRLGAWAFIGAWLSLKTLAQWKGWSTERGHYNRFLVGNAIVLLFSAALLANRVVLAPNGFGPAVYGPIFRGTWRGEYHCGEAPSSVALKIDTAGPYRLTALFESYVAPANTRLPSGHFSLSGSYTDSAQFTFGGPYWDSTSGHPPLFTLVGALDPNVPTLSGTAPGCIGPDSGVFHLHKTAER